MENELQVFAGSANFEHAQRVAKMLSSSSLIPKDFQNNVQNVMIALELANRIGASPLMIMQNLFIVHGKPSWSSTFIIAAVNSCKRFSSLKFEVSGEGDERGCVAWATELATNERLESPKVTLKMANGEGWLDRSGSKWKTMPDLMMRYRSAAFFGRLYAPEVTMGMHTVEETVDIVPIKIDKEAERALLMIEDSTTLEDLENIKAHIKVDQQDFFNDKKTKLENAK